MLHCHHYHVYMYDEDDQDCLFLRMSRQNEIYSRRIWSYQYRRICSFDLLWFLEEDCLFALPEVRSLLERVWFVGKMMLHWNSVANQVVNSSNHPKRMLISWTIENRLINYDRNFHRLRPLVKHLRLWPKFGRRWTLRRLGRDLWSKIGNAWYKRNHKSVPFHWSS